MMILIKHVRLGLAETACKVQKRTRLQILRAKHQHMRAMQCVPDFIEQIIRERLGQVHTGHFGSHAAPGFPNANHSAAFQL
jgi:hypothetical protein